MENGDSLKTNGAPEKELLPSQPIKSILSGREMFLCVCIPSSFSQKLEFVVCALEPGVLC